MRDRTFGSNPRKMSSSGDSIEDAMAKMEISVADSMTVFGGLGHEKIFAADRPWGDTGDESSGAFGPSTPMR